MLKTLQAIKQTSNSLRRISSDEGLTLETSAFESLYGGQFTLSTQLITTSYLVILSTDAAPHFLLRNLHPLDFFKIHYRGLNFEEIASFRSLEDEYGTISGLSLWCGPPRKQHHTDTHLPAIYTG